MAAEPAESTVPEMGQSEGAEAVVSDDMTPAVAPALRSMANRQSPTPRTQPRCLPREKGRQRRQRPTSLSRLAMP